MPFVYILFSKSLNRFYIGSTSGSLQDRMEKHFHKKYGYKAFTAKTDDWIVFWSVYSDCIAHSKRIEKKLKAMKSRVYLQNLVKYPELTNKIYEETR